MISQIEPALTAPSQLRNNTPSTAIARSRVSVRRSVSAMPSTTCQSVGCKSAGCQSAGCQSAVLSENSFIRVQLYETAAVPEYSHTSTTESYQHQRTHFTNCTHFNKVCLYFPLVNFTIFVCTVFRFALLSSFDSEVRRFIIECLVRHAIRFF